MTTNPTKKLNKTTYFENLTIRLYHVLYVLNMYVKNFVSTGCYLLFDS